MARFSDYYRLTKPGIVYGNLLTTLAAFLFASHLHFGVRLFLATMVGLALVVASACVFNNYLDRGIDRKMDRTKNRPLVTGVIRPFAALIYASILGVVGLALLFLYVNTLTVGIALFGLFMYVVVYGYAKRMSSWGTIVGSIPGAIPIVVGYTAFTNRLDPIALILFLILVLWQMPHFYAIALFRLEEYRAAGIPVRPLVRGMRATAISIVGYILAFIVATCALFVFYRTGPIYLAAVLILGFVWLLAALKKSSTLDEWARRIFRFSLFVLLGFSIVLAIVPITA